MSTTAAARAAQARVEAHHPRGYDEAHILDVDWLCAQHHHKAHRVEVAA